MTTISIIGIFVGLAVLIFLSMKGYSVFISALLASVIIALTGGVTLEQALLKDFMGGFTGFVSGNFMVFAAGALMGKIYEITGGAKAVAHLFIKLFGKNLAPYALLLAVIIMAGGGITGFVLVFALFPIAVEVFREADLPRYIIPGLLITGCCTVSSWGAGVAQPVNNIYATTFNTTLMGAPVPSIIMMIASLAFTMFFLHLFLAKAKGRGEHFVASEYDRASSEEALPNGWVALIPLIVALALINVKVGGKVLMPTAFGIFIGAALAYALMFKFKSDDKPIKDHIGAGFASALTSIGNTAAMAAVGGVAKSTVGFTVLLDSLLGMGGNPLISAAICGFIICGVTGGATGGLSMIGPSLAASYGAMGVNLAMVGRIIMTVGHSSGTLPNGGFINTVINGVAHDTYKNSYKYCFVMCSLSNLFAVIVGIIVMSVMGIYV